MKYEPFTTGLGIEVSDHHYAAQVGFGSVIRMEVVLPGLVRDEHVEKPDELKSIVKDKLTSFGLTERPYRVTILVPESRIFSHSTEIPRTVPAEDRKRKAREIAQREIPVPFSQARLCLAVGNREGEVVPATTYVIEKQVFDPLHAVFTQDFLRLVAMEANTKALLRLLTMSGSQRREHTWFWRGDVATLGPNPLLTTGHERFSRTVHMQQRAHSKTGLQRLLWIVSL